MKKIFINTRAGTQRFSAAIRPGHVHDSRARDDDDDDDDDDCHPPGTAMTFVAASPRRRAPLLAIVRATDDRRPTARFSPLVLPAYD